MSSSNQTPQNKPDFKTGSQNPNQERSNESGQQVKKDVTKDQQPQPSNQQKTGTKH